MNLKFTNLSLNHYDEKTVNYDELTNWIKRFGQTRAFTNLVKRYCDKNILGDYNVALLKWTENIPLKKLSDNEKLELMKNCRCNPSYEESFLFRKNIDDLFSSYSASQIKTIFMSSFSGDKYVNSILKCKVKNYLSLLK